VPPRRVPRKHATCLKDRAREVSFEGPVTLNRVPLNCVEDPPDSRFAVCVCVVESRLTAIQLKIGEWRSMFFFHAKPGGKFYRKGVLCTRT
jgi:hypothetical protein